MLEIVWRVRENKRKTSTVNDKGHRGNGKYSEIKQRLQLEISGDNLPPFFFSFRFFAREKKTIHMFVDGSVQQAEARPVISRRKLIAGSANKVDHLNREAKFPMEKNALPLAGRFHADPSTLKTTPPPPPCIPKAAHADPRPLNLFTSAPDEPPRRCASAPRTRQEASFNIFAATPKSHAPDAKSRGSGAPPSTLQLTYDENQPIRPPSPRRQVAISNLGGVSILAHSVNAPVDPVRHGRLPSPVRNATPTKRVIEPDSQDAPSSRRALGGLRPVDHAGSILSGRADVNVSVNATERQHSLRTKISPFTPNVKAAQKASTNPRHVVQTPQPSNIFGGAKGGSLCFWDYKFSSIQRPQNSSLLIGGGATAARKAIMPPPMAVEPCHRESRRAATPPARITDTVRASGKKRIAPSVGENRLW